VVRVRGPREFYWLNLGGWDNRRHSFEKCIPAVGRQGPVGPGLEGRIEKDRWYCVRVRCEGGRLTAFLDDRLLLEYEDAAPIASGTVGLGTWHTRARFRNLRVASLDGRVLFEGRPPLPPPAFEAPHWSAVGDGAVEVRAEGALNADRYAFVRNASEGKTGLRQTNLCVRAGDTLRGSFWAKGRAPDGVTARIAAERRALCSVTVPLAAADWVECPVALTPAETASNAVLEIVVGAGAEVWLDQVSLMPDSAAAPGGFRPDLLQAIASCARR